MADSILAAHGKSMPLAEELPSYSIETLPVKKTPEDVIKEMIRITSFEMIKNEIFFPEEDEQEEW